MARVPAPKPRPVPRTKKAAKVKSAGESAAKSNAREADPDREDQAQSPKTVEPTLRKKDLIDRVVAVSGVKKKDAKPVVEAMLAEMGAALARGEGLHLQPFGNLRIAKTRNLSKGGVLTCKIRLVPPAQDASGSPLAEPAE